ncbi:MAG: hypothetical protein KDH94_05595, partial [Coxiellaceae bacterium]|nr:hypothetical protein [Coxiellaceae bacterium]
MDQDHKFNPFRILPENVMLSVIATLFEKETQGGYTDLMNYKAVSKELVNVLGDQPHFDEIMATMPNEFNVDLVHELEHRKINTKEGRYRAGVALLFLKFLYSQVKPFPDDRYLEEHYDLYKTALERIVEDYVDYPMVIYINGYVAFQIAKRLLTRRAENGDSKANGGAIYKIALDSIIAAEKLDHPLAPILHDDTELQLFRNHIHLEDFVDYDQYHAKNIVMDDIIRVLCPGRKVDLSFIDPEDKEMIVVTWQKLAIENCIKARDLFNFALDHETLQNLTHYFHQCFIRNHFHRHVLAYNSVFLHCNQHANILKLFKTYKVSALVDLYQAFRTYYPRPDSLLFSILLTISKDELKDMMPLVDHILSLPQKGTQGWKICFLDGYRDAMDDGTLRDVSLAQMKMVLSYIYLVDHAGLIDTILERDVLMLHKIFHCNQDKIHKIAVAIVHQLTRFSTFDPLGHLDHQEVLLAYIYTDIDMLIPVSMKDEKDCDLLAKAIIQSYKKHVSDSRSQQAEIIVPEYIQNNAEK